MNQLEPMQAWFVTRWFDPVESVVVIGTRADAEAKADSFEADGEADGVHIEGPYEYSIAIKP